VRVARLAPERLEGVFREPLGGPENMSNRLYVGNLSFHTTEPLLAQRFAECGGVRSVSVMVDRETGQSRGFAFVEMETPEATLKAIAELDGQRLEGRALRVRAAEHRWQTRGGSSGIGGGFGEGARRRGR
jgi:cold-inducible RNA-binding protein